MFLMWLTFIDLANLLLLSIYCAEKLSNLKHFPLNVCLCVTLSTPSSACVETHIFHTDTEWTYSVLRDVLKTLGYLWHLHILVIILGDLLWQTTIIRLLICLSYCVNPLGAGRGWGSCSGCMWEETHAQRRWKLCVFDPGCLWRRGC